MDCDLRCRQAIFIRGTQAIITLRSNRPIGTSTDLLDLGKYTSTPISAMDSISFSMFATFWEINDNIDDVNVRTTSLYNCCSNAVILGPIGKKPTNDRTNLSIQTEHHRNVDHRREIQSSASELLF